jgi:hypothetical protein
MVRTSLACAAAAALSVLAYASAARATGGEEPRFDNRVHGAFLGAGFGASAVGDALMGELGGESAGLRSFAERRTLLAWDVRLAAKGGYLGNQHPFLFLLGVHSTAWVEYGVRFTHHGAWSPYVGGRLGSELQLMGHPGLAGSAFDTINSVDGVGGVVAGGTLRVDAGASLLDETRSLLLLAFAQEQLQAPRTNTPGLAFTQGGLGARFDIAGSVIAELDGVWGVAATREDPLRGLHDQKARLGVSGSFRKIFANGMWLGATLLWMHDTDTVAYDGGLTYGTGDAPTVDFEVFFGVPLWRTK